MTSLYFITPTKLDSRAVVFMGVSVKENPGAIGQFGTGLKYAIAWLLRNDHRVVIDGTEITSHRDMIRGKEFELVYFGDQPAGFTTDLGRNWEGWMAFRELYANTLDEGGKVQPTPIGLMGGSVIEVVCPEGSDFLSAYADRDSIILPKAGRLEGTFLVMDKPSKHFYVRGVRAGDLPVPSIFTWNHMDPYRSMLTEDRLVSRVFSFLHDASKAVVTSENAEFIRRCVLAPEGTLEAEFDYKLSAPPGRVFKEVVTELKDNPKVNQCAVALLPEDARSYRPVKLDSFELRLVQRACRVASKVCPIEPKELYFTRDFGEPTLAMFDQRSNRIWISMDAFTRGEADLVATILEEALHKHRGFSDCSRSMQNYLLNQLAYRLMKEDADV